MSESEYQQQIIDLAHSCGWRVAHFRTVRVQRANGSVYYATALAADGAGFPDLVLVRERVIYAEIKTNRGVLSEEQKIWRDMLLAAGEEWYVWKPKDFESVMEVLK